MEPPWKYDYKILPGLPNTFGYTAQGSAPTGWAYSGYVEMSVAATSYYARDSGLNVQRATWEFDVLCTASSGANAKYTNYFVIGDTTRSAQVTLTPSAVQLWINGGATLADQLANTNMRWFRNIRFIKDGANYRVWVDRKVLLRGTATSSADDRAYFGQGTAGPTTGTMAIRNMKWTNAGAFDPGPGLWLPSHRGRRSART